MISVIMLTYNRENLVGRAIESILNQTFRDFEFIMVDNGSTDRSGAIADEYAAKDSRIRVLHCRCGNIGSGRNAGLDAAQGDYIAFVDDDDTCEPDFLEFLYKLAVENNAAVSICGTLSNSSDQRASTDIVEQMTVMNTQQAIITLMWRKLYNTGFPTKLIDSSLFRNIRFAETGKYDDISLMYKVLAGAKTVAYHGMPKYHVYRHAGNNSSVTTKDNLITAEYLDAYRKAYRERTHWLGARFPNQSDYWWYFYWSFQISMVNKIVTNKIKNCEIHLAEIRSELAENRSRFLNSSHILDFEKKWMEIYVKAR
ncbi:glycosyltransferase [Anaerosporomusa subterranea]|uniref:Glycosyltransferase n=2 Tax=Anaerosporomusa subterranea TaxID=1794912 RepID=A0A154BRB9_ANASB|nr:glycosyltransferase [Anaerosporomusa subterranea]